jgi:hypothetical protein
MQIALSGEHSHAPGEIAVTLNVFIQRHKEIYKVPVIVEARFLAPMLSDFQLIENAKNRTFQVVYTSI